MMTLSRAINLAILGFFLVIIVIIFWQIGTDLEEQGIASGGPYDDAASYPQTIAVLIGSLSLLQFVVECLKDKVNPQACEVRLSDFRRAGMMLMVFAVYLMVLTIVGYHLATILLIFAVMRICGMRHYLKMAFSSVAVSTSFAFVFEVFLNVVLPLGIWNIFIPW